VFSVARITTERNWVKSQFAIETQYTMEIPEAGTISGTLPAKNFSLAPYKRVG
jgi:hypothetical protein